MNSFKCHKFKPNWRHKTHCLQGYIMSKRNISLSKHKHTYTKENKKKKGWEREIYHKLNLFSSSLQHYENRWSRSTTCSQHHLQLFSKKKKEKSISVSILFVNWSPGIKSQSCWCTPKKCNNKLSRPSLSNETSPINAKSHLEFTDPQKKRKAPAWTNCCIAYSTTCSKIFKNKRSHCYKIIIIIIIAILIKVQTHIPYSPGTLFDENKKCISDHQQKLENRLHKIHSIPTSYSFQARQNEPVE